jgi:hypothetical protein
MKALTFFGRPLLSSTLTRKQGCGLGDRWIVHGELCDHRQDLDHCGYIFDRYRPAVLSLGPGWVRRSETGLAWARECESSTSRWASFSPPLHCG